MGDAFFSPYPNLSSLIQMQNRRVQQDFNEAVKGASSKDVMDLLLLSQYFDCIREVGHSKHCKTTFVPNGTTGSGVRDALLVAEAAKL